MNPIIPYIFFLYIFIITWVIIKNYDLIKSVSKSKLQLVATISLLISSVVFVGLCTIYYIDCHYYNEDFEKKFEDLSINLNFLLD